MAMTVWISRINGADSAKAVREMGHAPLLSPLLKLSAASTPASAPPDDDVLAFTSPNAVRAFAALTDRREWRVYCTGDATAALAKALGFKGAISASGNVSDLAALLIKDAPQSVTYLSGVHIAGDLMGALKTAGIDANRAIIYATRPVTHMPKSVAKHLQSGEAMAVLLYSPKGARALAALLSRPECTPYIPNLSVVSLSPNVDASLGLLPFSARHIASAPNETALMRALETALAKA
jgi:uroporphyrinogen-III synthase